MGVIAHYAGTARARSVDQSNLRIRFEITGSARMQDIRSTVRPNPFAQTANPLQRRPSVFPVSPTR